MAYPLHRRPPRRGPRRARDGSGDWPAALQSERAARTARPTWQSDSALGQRKLCAQLGTASLAGFNAQELTVAHAAAAAVLSYAEHTTGGGSPGPGGRGQALQHVRKEITSIRSTRNCLSVCSTHCRPLA